MLCMKKTILLIVIFLVSIAAFGQNVNQRDFYGLWEFEYYEDFPGYYFINSTTLAYFMNDVSYGIWSDDIISWQPYINVNINTKNDYPYGYILFIKTEETNGIFGGFTRTILIHKDKKKIFFDIHPDDIYIKK